jgi:hypothetical protein
LTPNFKLKKPNFISGTNIEAMNFKLITSPKLDSFIVIGILESKWVKTFEFENYDNCGKLC